MKGGFRALHPAVGFLYFLCIIVFSMTFTHPFIIITNLLAALLLNILLTGARVLLRTAGLFLPFVLFVTLLNAFLSSRGHTVLFYLFGNAFTAESLLYGLFSGLLLINVVLWFGIYNQMITTDKFLYLFAPAAPNMAMLTTMTLRLIPLFKLRIHKISQAQTPLQETAGTGRLEKIKRGIRVISVLMTWSMEESIETADSMKARAYAVKKRTYFSLYRLHRYDIWVSVFGLFCLIIIAAAGAEGIFTHNMYRGFVFPAITARTVSAMSVYCLFIAVPLAAEVFDRIGAGW